MGCSPKIVCALLRCSLLNDCGERRNLSVDALATERAVFMSRQDMVVSFISRAQTHDFFFYGAKDTLIPSDRQ